MTAWISAADQAAASPANEQRWLLLPSTSEGQHIDPQTLIFLADALRSKGVYPLAFDEARATYEALASSTPSPTQESDLEVVAQQAQAALVHVATGQSERARLAVEKVLQRAEQVLESLNRQNESAKHVLNACLYLVRSLLDAGDTVHASERVLQCRRLVPDIEPDPYDHPPSVIRLMKDAERRLAAQPPTGRLNVRSTPTGCSAFVNGRRLGTTPFEIGSLPAGSYRVQVECGPDRRGRVHLVSLGQEPKRLEVDLRFESAVQTQPQLELRYAHQADENSQRFADALHIAQLLQVSDVVVLTPESTTTLRIDRFNVAQRRVMASAWLPVASRKAQQRKHMNDAAEALFRGDSLQIDAKSKSRRDPWVAPVLASSAGSAGIAVRDTEPPSRTVAQPATTQQTRQRPKLLPILGWTLGALGAGALATGWTYWAKLRRDQDRFEAASSGDVDYLDRQQDFDRHQRAVWISAGISGALLTASVPLWLPEVRRDSRAGPPLGVPWWSWVAGGVGLGVAAGGIAMLAMPRSCVDALCTRREPNSALGSLLLAHAAPLITMPIVHLIRGGSRPSSAKTRGGFFVDPNQALLFVRGDL